MTCAAAETEPLRASTARRVRGPVALALAGVAAAGFLAARNPFAHTVFVCPTYALTGVYCPGCGATRAVWALLHGQMDLALRCNAVLVAAAPVVALIWADWFVRAVRPARPQRAWTRWALGALAVVLLVFGVLRNLPGLAPYLTPPVLF